MPNKIVGFTRFSAPSRPWIGGAVLTAGLLIAGAAGAQDEDSGAELGAGPNVQITMRGALGLYEMTRDGSGTSWQPDSAPMIGMHAAVGDWAMMLHGQIFAIYDAQGGPRGADKTFSVSMAMLMAQHDFDGGRITFSAMMSLDALMGSNGYPLLLQTGETANGVTPLVDRQHPHDLFMELAVTYMAPLSDTASVFVYVGYPGEPALGPTAFMHRASGMDNPEAPITHHWMDSTHITYGVVTAGLVFGAWKIETSVFNGREPDQYRYGFDSLRLDSASARLTWNPSPDWSLQISHGTIKSPEQLEPDVDQHRTTASVTYNRKFEMGNWQTIFAWGRNTDKPGKTLDALLVESAFSFGRNTIFTRAENVDKDELFKTPDPRAGLAFDVSKISLGYVYDFPVAEHVSIGVGGLGSFYALPAAVGNSYGPSPVSTMLFLRARVI